MRISEQPFNVMAIGCIVIAGVLQAAQQALTSSPKIHLIIPWLNLSGNWNYIPLILITIAGLIFLLKQFGIIQNKSILEAIPTNLRLQFHPNSINPINLYSENIANWYALCHIFTVVEPASKTFKQGRELVNKQWSIFLVFDKPVAIKQITVDGNGAKLPITEIKNSSSRHAVITVSDDIGGAVLDIKAII